MLFDREPNLSLIQVQRDTPAGAHYMWLKSPADLDDLDQQLGGQGQYQLASVRLASNGGYDLVFVGLQQLVFNAQLDVLVHRPALMREVLAALTAALAARGEK